MQTGNPASKGNFGYTTSCMKTKGKINTNITVNHTPLINCNLTSTVVKAERRVALSTSVTTRRLHRFRVKLSLPYSNLLDIYTSVTTRRLHRFRVKLSLPY